MAPGSAVWAFEKQGEGWAAKTTMPIDEETRTKIGELVDALEEHEDVQGVYTNIIT